METAGWPHKEHVLVFNDTSVAYMMSMMAWTLGLLTHRKPPCVNRADGKSAIQQLVRIKVSS